MYKECPQKYKFKYIDKIPEKPRHFFSFGSSVHQALEFFYGVKTLPAPSLEEVVGHYRERWISAGYRDEAQEAEYFEDGKAIIARFHEKHLKDYALPFFVEYQFNLEVEGVPVTGKVDRIDKLPDGRLSILDYKTGKAIPADRVTTDAQLTMYQLACESLLGAEVGRLSFYHLPSLKEHVVDRRPPDLIEGLKGRIVSTAESITQGRFEPDPAEMKCRWCDFKPICPVFRQSPPPEAAAPQTDELSALVDRYGELLEGADALRGQAEEAKASILASLAKRGYVRAFGARFEVTTAAGHRWEFADKKKVLDILRQAGLYDRVLAPSAPKVEALMADPQLDLDLRSRLQELGEKVNAADLKVKRL
jgi:RecB family exonuclease